MHALTYFSPPRSLSGIFVHCKSTLRARSRPALRGMNLWSMGGLKTSDPWFRGSNPSPSPLTSARPQIGTVKESHFRNRQVHARAIRALTS